MLHVWSIGPEAADAVQLWHIWSPETSTGGHLPSVR